MAKQKNPFQDQKWNSFGFGKTLAKFVMDEPFYSLISCELKKIKTDSVKTACVSVIDNRPVLYYNEDFFLNLNWRHRQGLLKHEFLHIMLGHCTIRAKYKNGKPDPLWYICVDLSVNSLINYDYLPPNGIIPGRSAPIPENIKASLSKEQLRAAEHFRKKVIGFPKGKSAEWYYNQIEKEPEARKGFDVLYKKGCFNTTDSHEGWEKSFEGLEEEKNEELKQTIEEIIEKATRETLKSRSSKRWGSLPKEMKKELENKYSSGVIRWQSLLDLFIGNSETSQHHSTIKKINKRYEYIHPGKRRSKITNVAIVIDNSYSVDDKLVSKFFSELNNLSKIVDFTVIPFDSEVVEDKIFVWKKGEKISAKRFAMGGTNFTAPTKWINKNSSKFNAAIFMTDGQCSKPIACLLPRLWILPPDSKLLFKTNELVLHIT